jgi:hypothetical protein
MPQQASNVAPTRERLAHQPSLAPVYVREHGWFHREYRSVSAKAVRAHQNLPN